ncbi:MAG: SUMF1/EgtB/PvdO family nonheme iron enzyme [Cyclobacteriaceae bacterium]
MKKLQYLCGLTRLTALMTQGLVMVLLTHACLNAQFLQSAKVEGGFFKELLSSSGRTYSNLPLCTYQIGEARYSAATGPLMVTWTTPSWVDQVMLVRITIANKSSDTITIHNVVPFDQDQAEVYITGRGNHRLSRTHLFRAGKVPVNIIVPDNAWELGYAAIRQRDSLILTGLVRRDDKSIVKGTRKRFETVLFPGGQVSFDLHAELVAGEWQDGLRRIFQTRKLYDLISFDENLYNRKDLGWIRKAYSMHLLMAWDKQYYNSTSGAEALLTMVRKGKLLYGGDDVVCLWPTWPTLGLDQRNQFDMYRDLPGGLSALRSLADTLRAMGTRFFVAYNPWDESTRKEGHLEGLERLIRATGADGVVLDTKGESSAELQAAADKVKPGVVMYSEGMAVPRDMPGIVAGRVHNALYYPPMLNLNKLIRPDFAIFRVAEVFKEPISREYALSLFNGYGTEINQFAPGHPDWEDEQYRFWGRTLRILREHTDAFTNEMKPLVPVDLDSLWVNQWRGIDKEIYTIYNLRPEGVSQFALPVRARKDWHYVDLWNHRPLTVRNGRVRIETSAFDYSKLGTNDEGSVGCIGHFPVLVQAVMTGSRMLLEFDPAYTGSVWKSDPSYDKQPHQVKPGLPVDLAAVFGSTDGKFVIQIHQGDRLVDEQVVEIRPGTPLLYSQVTRTVGPAAAGMIYVPGGQYYFHTTHGDDFIPYPLSEDINRVVGPFLMDRYPVTNQMFLDFLQQSHYRPVDTTNFLKHWKSGRIPKGEEKYPVVYVSLEDARAYARWAGKRLPTELEWQYAAAGGRQGDWPWIQSRPVKRVEQVVTETLTFTRLEGIDRGMCNLGDGKPRPVGSFPKGANGYGIEDLVGSIWQLTNDEYESGSYRYIMMKGGSYFKPSSSWWYVQGGPREIHYRQYLLRVSQGFERNSTVGFRCVQDVEK